MTECGSAIKQIDALYRKRDEQLAQQDFKGAADTHFEFHRLVYASWPAIYELIADGERMQEAKDGG